MGSLDLSQRYERLRRFSMDNFEKKIEELFDFNVAEEAKKDDVITEGLIEKAKMVAKKAISAGIEKVLPPECLSFVQGLFAAAKQGAEAVAEFLSGADQDKVNALISVAGSQAPEVVGAAVKEDIDKKDDVLEEGGAEIASELATRGQDVQQAISSGAGAAGEIGFYITVALGLAAAYGIYRVIRAGIKIYKEATSPKRSFNKARRR